MNPHNLGGWNFREVSVLGEISAAALFIRFLLGGSAVVLATIVPSKVGSRVGGIFAAFPAVYLAALLTQCIDCQGLALIEQSIALSKGAVVGMAINIVVAILAGYLLPKNNWKAGILKTLVCWFMLSSMVILLS